MGLRKIEGSSEFLSGEECLVELHAGPEEPVYGVARVVGTADGGLVLVRFGESDHQVTAQDIKDADRIPGDAVLVKRRTVAPYGGAVVEAFVRIREG